MPCCIIYENNYKSVESWENAFFNDCVPCGQFKLKGKSGERDKRIFISVKTNLNKIHCCVPGSTVCEVCMKNISSFEEVQNISLTENRQIAYCVCCSVPFCFALENKPSEIDVIYSSIAAGNANNNNNSNNIVINNPEGGTARETNLHDVMMAQTLAQQQQFNAMMQLKMLEALNSNGGRPVANPIIPVDSPAEQTAPVAEVGIAPEKTE